MLRINETPLGGNSMAFTTPGRQGAVSADCLTRAVQVVLPDSRIEYPYIEGYKLEWDRPIEIPMYLQIMAWQAFEWMRFQNGHGFVIEMGE